LWLCFCRESKNKEWPRPCFCRGSSAKTNVTLLLQGVNISTNLNNCAFAPIGSRKIKNGQDLAFAGDQLPKQMWPCFCKGSTYQNFESEDNFSLDLVSEDHGTTFFLIQFLICSWINACLNTWESMICLCFECIYECMMYFLMFGRFDFSTKEWMHDFMLMHEILTHMRFFTFNVWGFWFAILLLSLNQIFL